jgi:5-methylcytosine-specific restriction enzyme subunit McrC
MSSSKKTYTITEYTGFTCDRECLGYQRLPVSVFNQLEEFVIASNGYALDFFSLTYRKNLGKVIVAKNYVGIITLKDGTVIEVLPKLAKINDEAQVRHILIDMLRTLRNVPFKQLTSASLHVDKMNIFEIFIKMFLDEVTVLTKQGLKSAYSTVEENQQFYKGKLLTSLNIRHNLINKQRFYVSYDQFNQNRAENRLIKTTLELLVKLSCDSNNRRYGMRLLDWFSEVDTSKYIDQDLSALISERSMNHYNTVMTWCRIFLKGNSFTPNTGNNIALSLLFPMEQLFESYVSTLLKRNLPKGIQINLQESKYNLFDQPVKAFALRPDIVVRNKESTFVLDAKWKILSDDLHNFGINQSDMYQVYTYGKKYKAKNVILIYPLSEKLTKTIGQYQSEDEVNVIIYLFDFLKPIESVIQLNALCC